MSGCGAKSGKGHARLTFAAGGAPAELAVWEEIGENFTRETGIPVSIERMPADSGQQRQQLLLAMKARQPDPDVFLMDVAWVGTWIASHWLEPLQGVDRNVFSPRVLQTVDLHGGRLMALPVYIDVGLLYYRTDLLKLSGLSAPPRTWDELRDSALKVQQRMRATDPDFYGFVWQGAQYEGLVVDFLEFAGTQGGFTDEQGRLRIDLAANTRALQFMRDCIWTWKISPPNTYTEMKEEEVRRYFQAGHALYERNWPYAWALHQAADSPVRGKVAVASLPAPEGGGPAPALGGYHAGISIFSDDKDDAARFVAYITSKPVQKMLTLRLGWNPGRRDLYDDPEVLARNPYFATLKSIIETARPRPVIPDYIQVSDLIQGPLSAALAGRETPQQALTDAQAAIDRLEHRYVQASNAQARHRSEPHHAHAHEGTD
jgi:trehalose/maltose transport system substrate-binding protein